MDYRPVLLFEGRRRRRAEDGAAVRDEAGDAALSSHRTKRGNPFVDAAPAVRPRKPNPGRPWPAVRRHKDRPPHVRGCTRRRRRSGGHRSGSRSHWGDLSSFGSTALRDRKRRKWSAGRRLVPIARDEETPRKRLGRPRQPLRRTRNPPCLPALRSPHSGAKNWSSARAYPAPT